MGPENYIVACLTPTASAPGADANTYPLFNSTTWTLGPGCLPQWGSRLLFTLDNSQAGTLKAYRSSDKGVSFHQVQNNIAVAAAPAGDVSGPYDFEIDAHPDFKLDWVNGGVAQATWKPTITIVRFYHGPAI